MAREHRPVMLREAVDALAIKPDGVYVDGTYGRGGHSAAILQQLGAGGRLIAIDQDPVAVAQAKEKFGADTRFTIVHASFAELRDVLERQGLPRVDGVLLDLGVSSPQLDTPERGFSFEKDGPLDMRMNTTTGLSAAEWLASAKEAEIVDVLFTYGEEKFARRIAHQVLATRTETPITTTRQLATLVEGAIPVREKHKHPATRTFQALRIAINGELDALTQVLPQVVDGLAVGGRAAMISFHSLEDRIVKQYFRSQEREPELPRGMPMAPVPFQPRLRSVGKPIKASDEEIRENPRSRSAVLRVVERL